MDKKRLFWLFFAFGLAVQLLGTIIFFLQGAPSDWHVGFSRLGFLLGSVVISFVLIEISFIIHFINNKKTGVDAPNIFMTILTLVLYTWLASMLCTVFPAVAFMIRVIMGAE